MQHPETQQSMRANLKQFHSAMSTFIEEPATDHGRGVVLIQDPLDVSLFDQDDSVFVGQSTSDENSVTPPPVGKKQKKQKGDEKGPNILKSRKSRETKERCRKCPQCLYEGPVPCDTCRFCTNLSLKGLCLFRKCRLYQTGPDMSYLAITDVPKKSPPDEQQAYKY